MISKCRNGETEISTDDSPVKIFVIPTDEELVMTEDTHALMDGSYDVHTKFNYTFQNVSYENKARAIGLKKQIAEKPEIKGIIAKPKGWFYNSDIRNKEYGVVTDLLWQRN